MYGPKRSARRTAGPDEIFRSEVVTACEPSVIWQQVYSLRWIRVKVRDVKSQWKRST